MFLFTSISKVKNEPSKYLSIIYAHQDQKTNGVLISSAINQQPNQQNDWTRSDYKTDINFIFCNILA